MVVFLQQSIDDLLAGVIGIGHEIIRLFDTQDHQQVDHLVQ